MQTKRILHVIDSLGVGGAEKLLIGIINNLTNYENHLLILRNPTTLKGEIKNIASFSNLNTRSFREALLKVPLTINYLREGKFDIIHSHLYESNIITRLSAPKSVPVFNSIHAVSSLASYKNSLPSLWLEKLTYRKWHHLIHVSDTVFRDFKEHIGIKGPSTVLYNFIEDVYFDKRPRKQFQLGQLRMVAVGNLREQKNYPFLIEAFKQIPKNVSLDIYGDGPLWKDLQRQISQHNLNIHLKGLQSNIHEVLGQYDVFVMSSHFEGQPVALLEAMACGLPALLSDIPVLREVGGNSALYFNLVDPGEFLKRIKEILHYTHNLEEMSAQGYQFALDNARKNVYMEKLQKLYLSHFNDTTN